MTRWGENEKRRAARAAVLGTAVVYLDGWTAHEYRLENLAAGGALLAGGPVLASGQEVRVVLRVGTLPTERIDARVIWAESTSEPRIALSFTGLDATLEDRLQDAVLSSLTRHRPRRVRTDSLVDLAPHLP